MGETVRTYPSGRQIGGVWENGVDRYKRQSEMRCQENGEKYTVGRFVIVMFT
jgi:hypothetical protein